MCKRSTTQARRKLYNRLVHLFGSERVPGRMIKFACRPANVISNTTLIMIMLDCNSNQPSLNVKYPY